jgi:glycosyltransferase involved in cell wall biosynthesis
MRILWASNAPWARTGYGCQTALVCERLVADGHDVAIAANYGLQGASTRWRGIEVLPGGYDLYSNDILPAHAQEHLGGEPGNGWLISLFDVWVFRNPRYQRQHMACWTPVDHRPAPAAVSGFFHNSGAVPIAMSHFGEEQLRRANLDPLYAPHGVDTSVYAPGDTAAARARFDLPADAFVVLVNAANKGRDVLRKSWFEAFAAFGELARRRGDAVLFVHSEQFGIGGGGINLEDLANACGIPPLQIRWIDQYAYRLGLSDTSMADLYRASDVLLAPSRGEGFGIPVIEAQACGRPVIVSDFSAQPELVGDGWLVDGEPEWDVAQQSCFYRPYAGSVLDRLEAAYDRGRGDSATAVKFAAGYDADLVHRTYWQPIVAQLQERLPDVTPIRVAS